MALIADGIHMASHVLFIGISWYAYVLVRHLQAKHNTQYNADRVLSLSAFASGILLLVLSVVIAVHAIERFFEAEVEIKYEEAMVVAGVGLVVNAICATVLHAKHGEGDYNSHSAYFARFVGCHHVIGCHFRPGVRHVVAHQLDGCPRSPGEFGRHHALGSEAGDGYGTPVGSQRLNCQPLEVAQKRQRVTANSHPSW